MIMENEWATVYRETEGDLFTCGLPAIGHGCNIQGVMGAGIAARFRRRNPAMYLQYRRRCKAGMFTLSSAFMEWVTEDGTVIFNLATQPDPGPTATLGQISFAVGGALEACASWNIPALGIPRIGAGLGGLQWADVRKTLQEVASQQDAVELVVVSLPEKTWPA